MDKQEVRIRYKRSIRNRFIVKLLMFMKYCGHPEAPSGHAVKRSSKHEVIGIPFRKRSCKVGGIIKSPLKPKKAKEMEQ